MNPAYWEALLDEVEQRCGDFQAQGYWPPEDYPMALAYVAGRRGREPGYIEEIDRRYWERLMERSDGAQKERIA